MALKVRSVGHVADGEISVYSDRASDFVALLTSLDEAPEQNGPQWAVPLIIGTPPSARRVLVTLARFLGRSDYEKSFLNPLLVVRPPSTAAIGGPTRFALFRNRFFLPERDPQGASEEEELTLRVKRAVYREDEELLSLRSYVSNVEAAIEFRTNGPQRASIPDDIKMFVWSRDGGACVKCGSKEKLHFDHVIPVSKGGGNSNQNIQILCETCNLRKSNKIGS
jgi:hypothetical protein